MLDQKKVKPHGHYTITPIKESAMYLCEICGILLGSKDTYRRHMFTLHSETNKEHYQS